MIRKLRLRFIISALLSILLVLSATIAAINVSNYLKSERETTRLLDKVVESERESIRRQNQGYWGDYYRGGGMGIPDETGHIYKESDPGKDDPRGQYFVAVYDTDGNSVYTNFHIISADKGSDQEMANEIYNGTVTSGVKDNYRYKKAHYKDVIKYQYSTNPMDPNAEMVEVEYPLEYTYVAFVDTTESMHGVTNYITNSIVVAVISYTVLAALIIISSHFVFKTSEESYRKQKAFITNASHELKTPLTIINTDLEILKMDNGDSEWTDSISDQVRRLTMMTNQLVTLSKLDEGNMKNYPFTTFSLSRLANESVDAFAPTFEKNGYTFTSDIDEDLDIKANQHLINELIYILLDNALKYTKEKGEVNLSVKKNKNRIEIKSSNDIEDDEIDVNQLFERFYRSPNTNKKEGSGIGLSIAKEIADLHKAKISAFIRDKKIHFVIVF